MTLLTTCEAAAEAAGVTVPTAVAGATDDHGRRIKRLAIQCAESLSRRHNWAILRKEGSITGDGSQSYDLPSDYKRGIPDSEWDRTQHRKLKGNITSLMWQNYQSGYVGATTLTRLFQFRANGTTKRIFFEPALESGTTIYFDYITNAIYDDGMGGQVSAWTDDSYTCLIDEHLIELGLVFRLKRSIGEDYQSEQLEFEHAFREIAGQDAPAETIYLGRDEFSLVAVTPETIPVP